MSYLSEVLADSPLFYYRFNELSGTAAADASGNGHNGTYQPSGITLGATGATNTNDSGKAILLTDPTSYMNTGVNAAANPGTGDFTIEAWIKRTVPDLIVSIVGKAPTGAGDKIALQLDNFGTLGLQLNNTTISGVGNVATNVYKHVVATRASGAVTLYVNGVVNKTATFATTLSPNANVLVGRFNLDDILLSGFATGTIDEVAWYTTALSQARIQAHFAAATAPPDPTPTPAVDNSIPLAYFWPARY
jgi:hypothetical protein